MPRKMASEWQRWWETIRLATPCKQKPTWRWWFLRGCKPRRWMIWSENNWLNKPWQHYSHFKGWSNRELFQQVDVFCFFSLWHITVSFVHDSVPGFMKHVLVGRNHLGHQHGFCIDGCSSSCIVVYLDIFWAMLICKKHLISKIWCVILCLSVGDLLRRM